MPLYGIEFSQFNVGGAVQSTDIIVGLRNGQNTQFTPPNVALSWTTITANTTMVGNVGYIVGGAGTIQLTLPAVIAAGQVIRIAGTNASNWQVIQHAGQYIQMGDVITTPGVGGFLLSTAETDVIEMLCVSANVAFTVLSSMGNIDFN